MSSINSISWLFVPQGDSIESMDKLNAHEKLKSREKFLVPYGFKPSSPAKRLYVSARHTALVD